MTLHRISDGWLNCAIWYMMFLSILLPRTEKANIRPGLLGLLRLRQSDQSWVSGHQIFTKMKKITKNDIITTAKASHKLLDIDFISKILIIMSSIYWITRVPGNSFQDRIFIRYCLSWDFLFLNLIFEHGC